MFNLFAKLMTGTVTTKERLDILFGCTGIEEALSLTDMVYPKLLEFADRLHDYGYLEARVHAKALSVSDVLMLRGTWADGEKIALKAKAKSVNGKLLSKLPCPPYFDSDGTAIWN